MSRAIHGTGTPEEDWLGWLARCPLPAGDLTSLVHAQGRLVVVAPHPDDEIAGAGGLLRQAARHGIATAVVAVTDGEASHPDSPRWPRELLRHARATESRQALHMLAPGAELVRLALPDGGVSSAVPHLVHALKQHVQPHDTVLSTWRLDGHPDHEATGVACALMAQQIGCAHFELPIWTWHWAHPGDTRVPWHRALAVPMGCEDLRWKRRAMSCFHSQLSPDTSTGKGPVLPVWATRRWLRPFEVVFL